MRRAAFVLLLAGVASLAAQDDAAPPADESYFPLAVGNRWVYRIAGQEDRLYVSAAGVEKVGDTYCIRLEGRLLTRTVATEHISVNRNGVLRHRVDGNDVDPPLPICRFPITESDSWQAEYRYNERRASVVCNAEFEEVTVPAGTFKALAVQTDASSRTGKSRTTCWYAPKVGMVKQTIDEGDRTITLLLERFEPASSKETLPKFMKKSPR